MLRTSDERTNLPRTAAVTRSATAVLWDMDGTLADSEPLHQRTLEAVLASLGVTPSADLFESTVGLAERDVHAYCVARYGLAIDAPDWIAFRNAAYGREAATLQARPGALDVLSSLAALGVRQAVVSNSSREVLDISLRALQVQSMLTCTVSRTDVQRGKPDPEPYLTAARLLGVDPDNAVVVEDSPLGAASGVAAGMTVAAWPTPGLAIGPIGRHCHVVASAAELSDFLLSAVQGAR